LLVVLGACVLGFRAWFTTEARACDLLRRADVRTVWIDSEAALTCDGFGTRSLRETPLERALAGASPLPVVQALKQDKGAAFAFVPSKRSGNSVAARLSRLEHVEGLQGIAVSPDLAAYGAAPSVAFTEREREALPYVARAMFRGAREPSLTSFPAALRRVLRSEVLVAIVDRGEPRLWRSARGTSIARALTTAARVARDRWRERESAMGGPLTERLASFDIEVSLLVEDGTLMETSSAFVDRAVTKAHGVGIDHRNDWYYFLPRDVAKHGKGSAHRALTALIAERGLAATAVDEPGARVYRFVPVLLGASRALPSVSPARAKSDDPSTE
jgi:hypothetical protein